MAPRKTDRPAAAGETSPAAAATATAELAVAVAALPEGRPPVIPEALPLVLPRRVATVTSPIDHDGEAFGVDDAILLAEMAFLRLRDTGALAEQDWDDLAEV